MENRESGDEIGKRWKNILKKEKDKNEANQVEYDEQYEHICLMFPQF